MKLYEKVLAQVYTFLAEIGLVRLYREAVEFCRKHWAGKAFHKIVRMAVLVFLITLVTKIDPSNLSSVYQALSVAGVAGFDELLDELKVWLQSLRERYENGK